jgi:uncharacterized membrane-anchored protein YhcB (DUF1043 family)
MISNYTNYNSESESELEFKRGLVSSPFIFLEELMNFLTKSIKELFEHLAGSSLQVLQHFLSYALTFARGLDDLSLPFSSWTLFLK